MMTSTAPSTSCEGWPFPDDDRPQREAARVKLIVTQLGPIGKELIQNFPSLHWTADDLKKVLDRYKALRDEAEALMKGQDGHCHFFVIDRHKVGAAFILAILDVGPLKIRDGHQETLEGERLANAILAFRTAVRIVSSFARSQGRVAADAALSERWRRPVVFPVPRDGKSYRHHSYRALHHAYRQKKLNLPLLANWLFTIEQYNNLANP